MAPTALININCHRDDASKQAVPDCTAIDVSTNGDSCLQAQGCKYDSNASTCTDFCEEVNSDPRGGYPTFDPLSALCFTADGCEFDDWVAHAAQYPYSWADNAYANTRSAYGLFALTLSPDGSSLHAYGGRCQLDFGTARELCDYTSRYIFSVNTATGSERWAEPRGGYGGDGYGPLSETATAVYGLTNDRGVADNVVQSGYDGTVIVVARDAADGSQLWKYKVDGVVTLGPGYRMGPHQRAVVVSGDGRTVYIALHAGKVLALNTATSSAEYQTNAGETELGVAANVATSKDAGPTPPTSAPVVSRMISPSVLEVCGLQDAYFGSVMAVDAYHIQARVSDNDSWQWLHRNLSFDSSGCGAMPVTDNSPLTKGVVNNIRVCAVTQGGVSDPSFSAPAKICAAAPCKTAIQSYDVQLDGSVLIRWGWDIPDGGTAAACTGVGVAEPSDEMATVTYNVEARGAGMRGRGGQAPAVCVCVATNCSAARS